jgi:hypothetical protein
MRDVFDTTLAADDFNATAEEVPPEIPEDDWLDMDAKNVILTLGNAGSADLDVYFVDVDADREIGFLETIPVGNETRIRTRHDHVFMVKYGDEEIRVHEVDMADGPFQKRDFEVSIEEIDEVWGAMPDVDEELREVDPRMISDERTDVCPTEDAEFPPMIEGSEGQGTRVFFKNQAKSTVRLFHVNSSGHEVFIENVEPGRVAKQGTYQGHIFHVRLPEEKGGRLLLRHRVGLFPFMNALELPCGASHLEKAADLVELQMPPLVVHKESALRRNYINSGFVNRAGCDINLWYWNGTGEELVGQLGTTEPEIIADVNKFGFTQSLEAVYLDHIFRARMTDGRLVQERKIDRVYIRDCAEPAMPKIGTPKVQHPLLLHPMMMRPLANKALHRARLETRRVTGQSVKSCGGSKSVEARREGAAACLRGPCTLSPPQLARQLVARPARAQCTRFAAAFYTR